MTPRQAVIVIHGMGEQIPMGTLNGFVDAVWTHDETQLNRGKPDPVTGELRGTGRFDNVAWYKPDNLTDSFELRRITTEASAKTETGGNRRTDFFEFYWAHHIKDMTIGDVMDWVRYLLWRNPFTSVPRDVLFTWCLLWLIVIGAFCLAVFKAVPGIYQSTSDMMVATSVSPIFISAALSVLAGLAVTALTGFIIKTLVSHFGDVVRYVRPTPQNVSTRQTIREEGVKFLETILAKEANGKPKYDRVVIVAHSLGTIVGYDILSHAFARMNTVFDPKSKLTSEPARAELERMIREDDFTLDDYQAQQNLALKELSQQGNPWRVTDFITLGSPLTHAEFLLEKNMTALRRAQTRRVFPTCPPIMEYDATLKTKRFTYGVRPKGAARTKASPGYPHHAAVFAYTRWHNIYSPPRFTLWGDQASGPLAENFGRAIRDVQVMPGLDDAGRRLKGDKRPFLAHVKYWRDKTGGQKTPHRIKILRALLNLSDG